MNRMGLSPQLNISPRNIALIWLALALTPAWAQRAPSPLAGLVPQGMALDLTVEADLDGQGPLEMFLVARPPEGRGMVGLARRQGDTWGLAWSQPWPPEGVEPAPWVFDLAITAEALGPGKGPRVLMVRPKAKGREAPCLVLAWEGEKGHVIYETLVGADEETGDSGEEVELADLDGDGARELLRYQFDNNIYLCGGGRTRIYPEVYDHRAGSFRPVSLGAPQGGDNLEAKALSGGLPQPLVKGFFRLLASSTDIEDGGKAGSIPRPQALEDGDPATAWVEGVGGHGEGAFVTASVERAVPISAVVVVPAHGRDGASFLEHNRLASAVLLFSEGQALRVTFPPGTAKAPGRAYRLDLPQPITSSCLSLMIDRVHKGKSDQTAIGELTILSELDLVERGEAMGRLIALLKEGAGQGDWASSLLSRLGKEALPLLHKALEAGPAEAVEGAAKAVATIGAANSAPVMLSALSGRKDLPREAQASLRELLANLGEAVVPQLEAALSDEATVEDGSVPLGLMAGQGKGAALKALLRHVGDGHPPMRKAILQGLVAAGQHAAAGLVSVLEGATTAPARTDIVRALAQIGQEDPQAARAIEGAWAREPSLEFRQEALRALAQVGGAAGRAFLASRLSDEGEAVLRAGAAEALGALGGQASVAPLIRALVDPQAEVRVAAAMALGWIKDPAAGPELIRLVSKDDSVEVRAKAAEVLAFLGPSVPAVQALIKALEDDSPRVRMAAASSLASLGAREAVPALVGVLGHRQEDIEVRCHAAAALGHLGDREAVGPLMDTLAEARYFAVKEIDLLNLAASAARALGMLGSPEAVASLIEAAKDSRSALVQRTALEALAALGAPSALPALEALVTTLKGALRRAAEGAIKSIKEAK